MVNVLWGVFIIIGVVFGFINGKIDLINNEIINSGKSTLELMLEMLPMLALWMGLMRIVSKKERRRKSNVIKHIAFYDG